VFSHQPVKGVPGRCLLLPPIGLAANYIGEKGGCSSWDQFGTTRSTRSRTTCTFMDDPRTPNNAHTAREQEQRASPISWGSSGRRFKSCQPDLKICPLIWCDVLAGRSDDPELGPWDHKCVDSNSPAPAAEMLHPIS